jgi:hypothetical protein
MAKALADGIEPEEPFLLTGIRQEHTDAVVVRKSSRLGEETIDQIMSALNTTRLPKTGSENDVMWSPSVELDPEQPVQSPG